jgi:hypothetical protein
VFLKTGFTTIHPAWQSTSNLEPQIYWTTVQNLVKICISVIQTRVLKDKQLSLCSQCHQSLSANFITEGKCTSEDFHVIHF